MTDTGALKCQHCNKEYVRRGALEKHIKSKHNEQAAQVEQDKTRPEIGIEIPNVLREIPNSRPYFAEMEIPDDLDPALLEVAEDLELYDLSEELDPSCKKCDDSYNMEKRFRKQIKALQNTKKILQRHSKDKDVELAASRELLAETTKEITKLKMEKQTNQQNTPRPQPIQDDEDIEVTGGIPCTYCECIASSMAELKEHFKKKHNLKCSKCSHSFLSRHSLEEHIKKKHTQAVAGYACETCQQVFKTSEAVKEHEHRHIKRKKERSITIQECPLCSYVTKNPKEVDAHMQKNHNIKVYRCDQCIEFAAGTKEHLREHMKEHGNKHVSVLSCGHFDYTTQDENDLAVHIDKKHNFTEVSTKQCWFYKRGKCDRGSSCRYRHDGPVSKQSETTKEAGQKEALKCTRGLKCKFKEQGRCHFFHEGVGVQMPKDHQNQRQSKETQEKRTHRLWCQFQESCKKGPKDCPFRHYEVEYPKLPAKQPGNIFK